MATTSSKITNIVEYLKAQAIDDKMMILPITEIDGVTCDARLDICHRGKVQHVRFQIHADYQDEVLFYKVFDEETTHEDIVAFIKTIRNMKYCKTMNKITLDSAEDEKYHERKFFEELLTADGEACNFKTCYDKCPVCLDNCYNRLSCGHHLCLHCESKLTKKKCPQCRDEYNRYQEEADY
jgi:hypothetical protein